MYYDKMCAKFGKDLVGLIPPLALQLEKHPNLGDNISHTGPQSGTRLRKTKRAILPHPIVRILQIAYKIIYLKESIISGHGEFICV